MCADPRALSSIELFQSLSAEEFQELAQSARPMRFGPGQGIVHAGEEGTQMFIICQGDVQVFSLTPQGREVIQARLGPGQWFGEQSLLPGRRSLRSASVRALGDVELLCIDKHSFQQAIRNNHPLKENLLELGTRQLHENLRRQSALFQALDLGESEGWLEERHFEDGELVFAQGSPAHAFFYIAQGMAAVYRADDDGLRLLVRLGPGQCFGDLGLLERRPRAASVYAEEALRLKVVDAQNFARLYEQSPELRDYLQTLQKLYLLPRAKGFATQHAGSFMGREAITTIYHLEDGRRLVASRVVGQDIYNIAEPRTDGQAGEAAPAWDTWQYRDAASGESRGLMLEGLRLVGLTVQGPWDELPRVQQMLLDGQDLALWQKALFEHRGSLQVESPLELLAEDDIICACVQVCRKTLLACVQKGCTRLDELSEHTGAGSVCGACTPRIKELLGQDDWMAVEILEARDVTPDVRRFRLRPLGQTPQELPHLPGQHILVQGRIEGRWVQRAYTLCDEPGPQGELEIMVRRERRGLFSNWLFQQGSTADVLRVSPPQGHFHALPAPHTKVVCMVAGVGVTPALAIARSLARSMQPGSLCHVHLSARTLQDAPGFPELEALAAQSPHVTLVPHWTSEQGRLDASAIATLAAQHPEALYMLCGPPGYIAHVRSSLLGAGIPEGAIHDEAFQPATVPRTTPDGPPKPRPAPSTQEHSLLSFVSPHVQRPVDIAHEARAYLEEFYRVQGIPQAFEARWAEVEPQIHAHGTYHQTADELAFGTRLAWRNAVRCIGRLYWQGLVLRDRRHVTDEAQMFEELLEHIRIAQNGGNLRSVITVFAPRAPHEEGTRIWNAQLLRYAGYRQPDGTILGDPGNVELTDRALALGWKPATRSRFDLLPIIIQHPGRPPRLFELPPDLALEVAIEHPDFAWFKDLGLRWYALPAVSGMMLDVGGLHYTCAPFNGWYMGTEIGARNFSDKTRYDMLPTIARRMGLETRRDRDMWRDRALVELNLAVLHSFEKAGMKMLDHHAASRDFMEFARQEEASGRPVYARWSWIVPPISASTTPVFHTEWEEAVLKPNYFYQPEGWEQREAFEQACRDAAQKAEEPRGT